MSDHASTTRYTSAIPCLSYTDAHAAIAWLVKTFDADARHVYDGPDATVTHAEVWFGSACVMMGSLKESEMPPHRAGEGCVYIVVESAEQVNVLYERVVATGTRIAISLRDTDYGSRDFGCLDPEGNFWGFGTYAPA